MNRRILNLVGMVAGAICLASSLKSGDVLWQVAASLLISINLLLALLFPVDNTNEH